MLNDSLLDDDTKKALELMSLPLKIKLITCQKHISDTLLVLQKLQTKLSIYLGV